MEHTQLRSGVVKRSRLHATLLRQARRQENTTATMTRWEVWYRFGDRRPVREAVLGCPHEAQAVCNSINAIPATRSWVKVAP